MQQRGPVLGLAGLLAAAGVGYAVWQAQSTDSGPAPEGSSPPNVLWVVWDTARADRMSVYGAEHETTPRLEEWAEDARIYDNVVAAAHSTLPSHASMFTGLTAIQHNTHYGSPRLPDARETIAELLGQNGYQTYLWSSNPHVSEQTNLHQGFDVVQHPWDRSRIDAAMAIVRAKVEGDEGTGVAAALEGNVRSWAIKAAGALAEPNLIEWLQRRETGRPWFAFVNYMEAHRQYIPSRAHRERFMTPEQVDRSYVIDQSWMTVWKYVFGLHEYDEADIEIMARTYDATLAELDEIFANLLEALESRGLLDDTIVVLTSDHGEQLGEHHQLDHQYSVYESVLRIPLIVHYPPAFESGRETAPVSNADLFPTLLELAGVSPPTNPSPARSLLRPDPQRRLFAEHPIPHQPPINLVRRVNRRFDATPWATSMCAFYRGDHKLIFRQGLPNMVFDLSRDPGENDDLAGTPIEEELLGELAPFLARHPALPGDAAPGLNLDFAELSEEEQERLRVLGYLEPEGPEARLMREQGVPFEVAPDMAPDMAPDLAPDVAPDMAPDVAAGMAPDVAPDMAAGMAPDVAAGMAR